MSAFPPVGEYLAERILIWVRRAEQPRNHHAELDVAAIVAQYGVKAPSFS